MLPTNEKPVLEIPELEMDGLDLEDDEVQLTIPYLAESSLKGTRCLGSDELVHEKRL